MGIDGVEMGSLERVGPVGDLLYFVRRAGLGGRCKMGSWWLRCGGGGVEGERCGF